MNVGSDYEQALARRDPTGRKANGVYYTPPALVDHIVDRTLGRFLEVATPAQAENIRIVDPACGCGAFLIAAYRRLLAWHATRRPLTLAQRWRILRECVYGADVDGTAVALTRRALLALAEDKGERGALAPRGKSNSGSFAAPRGAYAPRSPDRGDVMQIQTGDALLGIDWRQQFTVVLGNPPWGQKDIAQSSPRREELRRRYPSSAGIVDLFRPFVELGVQLTADGGRFGMVLPDIVLLKNYAPTRRLLLENLTLEHIDWWGQAFPGAQIDTATIIGRKQSVSSDHEIAIAVHDELPTAPLSHTIPQASFASHPRAVFNLHLTPARQRVLDRLAAFPRLGDFFEVHEGVHSGNMRAALFVDSAVDATCEPLLFGRDEITPYRLRWHGKYIRLGAPKPRGRYANLGRPEWHARRKLLVRRTGDRVLAAVDRVGRYASNNFFLVVPRNEHALNLDGVCALLNSQLMTWYFRAIEPRQGRAFAELKIKHLVTFPLPTTGCPELNALGKQRRPADALALDLFGLTPEAIE